MKVTVGGETITLLQAVKQVGGAGRVANLWKSVADASTLSRRSRYDPYGGGPAVRDPEQEVAKAQVTAQEAIELTKAASKRARALRAAIQTGNSQPMDIDINPALLVL